MKTPVTFRFSDSSLSILDGLCERFGLNRTAVLEFLLHQESRVLQSEGRSRERRRAAIPVKKAGS